MLKLVGILAVVWALFATGIAQLILIWTAVIGTTVFGG